MDSGIYCLILYLEKEIAITVGKLGHILFPKGYYVYTGRALKGLSSRIKRHLDRRKTIRWHIDYLLQYEKIKIVDILIYSEKFYTECEINKRVKNIEEATTIAKGFGSSDCKAKCMSHLTYFPEEIDDSLIRDSLICISEYSD